MAGVMLDGCKCNLEDLEFIDLQRIRAHIYRDLQPYVCTFRDCQRGIEKFITRRDWAHHEFEEHRGKHGWKCVVCSSRGPDQAGLERHMSQQHPDLHKSRLELMTLMATRAADQSHIDKMCPLCLRLRATTKAQFISHVSRHMREISQAAIPLSLMTDDDQMEDFSDDDNTVEWLQKSSKTALRPSEVIKAPPKPSSKPSSSGRSSGKRAKNLGPIGIPSASPSVRRADDLDTSGDAAVISFIIRIEDLEAPFVIRGPQPDSHKYWDPLKSSKELKVSNARFYSWRDSKMTRITSLKDLLKSGKAPLRQYNIGSIFFQKETGHLLITNIHPAHFDESDDKKWSRLTFNHKRVTPEEQRYYTELDFAGSKNETAAIMSHHYVPQLVPSVYK